MSHHLRRAAIAAAVVTSLALAPAAARADSFPLVGWWPMNEGSGQVVHDWSGHGNNGQLGSTPAADANDPSWIPGVFFGSALSFSGDDYIQIPDSTALEPANITVAAWVRGSSSPGENRYILSKGTFGCDHASYGLYTSSTGGLAFYVGHESTWFRSPEAPATVWDGKWHNVAGTFDGSTVRLYVDGKQVGTGTPAATTIDYSYPGGGNVGTYDDGACSPSLYLTGDVDGVQIWSRALPVDTIWKALSSLFTLSR
jgi:hypothetical protein